MDLALNFDVAAGLSPPLRPLQKICSLLDLELSDHSVTRETVNRLPGLDEAL